MDRGVPTEAMLEEMRRDEVAYLAGTRRHIPPDFVVQPLRGRIGPHYPANAVPLTDLRKLG